MELFERFEELSRTIERMNAQAVGEKGIPYILLHDYVHYCDVQTFFRAYTRRLRLPKEQEKALLAFCYRDTLERKSEIGATDLYPFTYQFFKGMTYRTGNLDTPDDCVEKLDLDLLTPYRQAREKEWRGEALSAQEQALLKGVVQAALDRCRG